MSVIDTHLNHCVTPPTLNYLIILVLFSVYRVTAESMLIGGLTFLHIGQGLLNYITNPDYVEPVVAPHREQSFTNDLVTTIKLY